MKKISILFLVSCSILAFAACGNRSSVRETLSAADALMQERPDSSLYVLQSIDSNSLKSKRLKAEHSLLLSMALDKNYIDLTSDSLINNAVTYYRRHNDYEKRFLSLYYQGRVYENAEQYSKAMLSFTEAEQIIDNVENDFAKGLLYAHLGDLHDKVYDYSGSLELFTKSEYYHDEAGRINHKYYSKLSMACSYIRDSRLIHSI